MRLREYLYINNIKTKDLAKKSGVSLQTLYMMMRGKNCRYFEVCKVIAATEGRVSIWDLLPEDLRESFFKDKDMTLNEEAEQYKQKARNFSKFEKVCF